MSDPYFSTVNALVFYLRSATTWKQLPRDEDLDPYPRAVRADASGDVVLRGQDDHDETFTLSAGEVLAVAPKRVLASGTTIAADKLKRLY